jgi:hypothetical protein
MSHQNKAPHLKLGTSRWAPLLLPSSFFFQFFYAIFFAISPPKLENLFNTLQKPKFQVEKKRIFPQKKTL